MIVFKKQILKDSKDVIKSLSNKDVEEINEIKRETEKIKEVEEAKKQFIETNTNIKIHQIEQDRRKTQADTDFLNYQISNIKTQCIEAKQKRMLSYFNIKNDGLVRELEDLKSFVDLDKLKRYKKGLEQKDKRLQLLADGMDVIAKAIKLDESNLEVKEQDFKDLFSPYLAALECRNVLTQTKALHALGKCIQELSYTGTDLRVRYKELKGLMKLVNQLNGLEGLVVREDSFSSKMSSYENLIQLNKTLQVLKKLNSIKVNEKTFSSKYEEYRRLRELLSSVRKIEATISQLEKDKKREEERIGSIEAKLKEFKVCPLCHHSLEENE